MEIYLNRSMNLLVYSRSSSTVELLIRNGFTLYLQVYGKNISIAHPDYQFIDGKSFKKELLEIDRVNFATPEELPLLTSLVTPGAQRRLAERLREV